jgi:hypothetical protein
MSLCRSLCQDYPDDPETIRWALGYARTAIDLKLPEAHRSLHSMDMLGRFQVVHDPKLMDYLAYEDPEVTDEYREPLRLPMLTCLLAGTTMILKGLLGEI